MGMASLFDLPALREHLDPMSVEAYHRLGEMGALSTDVELLRGKVVCKMPKSPLHEFVAQVLMNLLVRSVPEGFEVRREGPISIGNSEPEPDLSVVQGKASDWLQSHPHTAALVIEIAITSIELDEGKAAIYAEAGIPEYWIVQPELRLTVVYRQPSPDGYRVRSVLSDRETLTCATLPGIGIPTSSILPPRAAP